MKQRIWLKHFRVRKMIMLSKRLPSPVAVSSNSSSRGTSSQCIASDRDQLMPFHWQQIARAGPRSNAISFPASTTRHLKVLAALPSMPWSSWHLLQREEPPPRSLRAVAPNYNGRTAKRQELNDLQQISQPPPSRLSNRKTKLKSSIHSRLEPQDTRALLAMEMASNPWQTISNSM